MDPVSKIPQISSKQIKDDYISEKLEYWDIFITVLTAT